jgi:enoyl-CoA hydratase
MAEQDYKFIEIDQPRAHVKRITLNRPDKRNALSNHLRKELYDAIERGDQDDDVRVMIIRGAGVCFSAGYDLGANNNEDRPWHTGKGAGEWARHVLDGHFRVWDLATPLIAQVHGYCLAGGTELATSCDLVYVAEDAIIGYPVVRSMSTPDMLYHPWLMGMRAAMEAMLTGDSIDGAEAVRLGWANRALPVEELEDHVLERAERVAQVPPELTAVSKRAVHRGMEVLGIREAMRACTDIHALGMLTDSSLAHRKELRDNVTKTLSERDKAFGDYRESGDN